MIIEGLKTFDVVLRTDDSTHNSIDAKKIHRLHIRWFIIPSQQIASIQLENSFNAINHENTQRRIVVSANVQHRTGNTGQSKKRIIASLV